jgi:hypothetical protein
MDDDIHVMPPRQLHRNRPSYAMRRASHNRYLAGQIKLHKEYLPRLVGTNNI